MAGIQTDLDAVAYLRQALLNFVGQQRETIPNLEASINAAWQRLEQREDEVRAEVQQCNYRLQDCYRDNLYADEFDEAEDCSDYATALAEVEAYLARLLRYKAKAQATIEHYNGARQQLTNTLEHEVSLGMTFLDNLLQGLAAYQAASLTTGQATSHVIKENISRPSGLEKPESFVGESVERRR